jgi:hypothetical protein
MTTRAFGNTVVFVPLTYQYLKHDFIKTNCPIRDEWPWNPPENFVEKIGLCLERAFLWPGNLRDRDIPSCYAAVSWVTYCSSENGFSQCITKLPAHYIY